MVMHLAALPDQRAASDPGGSCLADGRRELDNATFAAEVRRMSSALVELGIGRGDVVAVVLPNSIDLVTVMFAAWRLGAALTPVNPYASLYDYHLRPYLGSRCSRMRVFVLVKPSGWRTAGDGRALWILTTSGAAVFQIAERCNREQFNALIGPYPGIVVADRWVGFEHLDPDRRQVCWSHIERDFRRHSEGLAEQKIFGEQGLQLTDRVFRAWPAYRHEHHDRDRLATEIAPTQTELRELLEHASPKSRRTRWHRRFANNLLKVWPRCGPSQPSRASSRLTTPPNAPSADQSSTARSPTAPPAPAANASPNAPTLPPPPAAYKTAHY